MTREAAATRATTTVIRGSRRRSRRRRCVRGTAPLETRTVAVRSNSGAVLRIEFVRDEVALATTANGDVRRVGVDASTMTVTSDADVGGGLRASVDARMRPPFWCARRASGTTDATTTTTLVGTSGYHIAQCAYDDAKRTFTLMGEALLLGPHTGYVRDVCVSADGAAAWSCACNFAPCWRKRDGSDVFVPGGDGSTIQLFTGDILRLCLFEREERARVLFMGTADGKVRAFDVSDAERPRELGTVADETRGRVVALAHVHDFIVSGSHDGRVQTHDATDVSAPKRDELTLAGKVQDIIVVNGDVVFVGGEFGVKIYRVDATSGKFAFIRDCVSDVSIRSMAANPKSNAVVLVGTSDGAVRLVDAR
jgi:hypothetical protein